MGATDGATPLNAANVVWKAGEDDHGVPGQATGHLHNYGNLEAIGGLLRTVWASAGPLSIGNAFVLGSGNLRVGFMIQHNQYPAAVSTYYHPTNWHTSVPLPGYVDIIPTTLAVTVESYLGCTVLAYNGGGATTNVHLCFRLSVSPTIRTLNQAVSAEGFVTVAA